MSDLSQEEWASKMASDDKAVIIDVRTSDECAEGIIPHAICSSILDAPAFMARVNNLDKSKHYYIYCRSGARSGQACQILSQQGFTCYNLTGGIMQWTGEVTEPS